MKQQLINELEQLSQCYKQQERACRAWVAKYKKSNKYPNKNTHITLARKAREATTLNRVIEQLDDLIYRYGG